MNAFTESVVEQAALDWFRALGYDVVGGPDMPPGPHALRESYADTIFPSVVRGALARLSPNLPNESLDDAFRKLTRPEGPTLEARVPVAGRRANGGFHYNLWRPAPFPAALAAFAGAFSRAYALELFEVSTARNGPNTVLRCATPSPMRGSASIPH